jgi:Ca2+-binding EF-hand superfamily protein
MFRRHAFRVWLAWTVATMLAGQTRAVETDKPTAEARQALADKFAQLDVDKDKKLSIDEFTAAADEAARRRLSRDFRVFDLDRDGNLTFDEFLTVPSQAPIALRGPLPDPIAELVTRWMSEIEKKWNVWDQNGDGELSRVEFAGCALAGLVPGLKQSSFDDWNRDARRGVSRDDCRSFLEVGCGVRRPDGQLLRTPSARVYNWMAFKHADLNRDDKVDHEEHIKCGFDGDQAEARFLEMDADHDGAISFGEWNAAPFRTIEPAAFFLEIDTNLDGRVDRAELLKGEPAWRSAIARQTFPAFDLDRDGFLSLHEYRLTPMANPIVKWHEPVVDHDSDGFLSLAEFRWESGWCPAILTAEYFRLFDANQDGRLDQDEFSFNTIRRDPQRDFRGFDTDEDGSLNEAELVGAAGDKPRIERLLKLFDRDADRRLSYGEFLTVPGLVPILLRGPLPDPIVKLVDAQMAAIDENWAGWDKNGDKTLDRNEFQSSGLARRIPGLILSTWQDWDQNGDGSLSRDDCRRLMEIAFGVRRPTGELLRYESGVTINAMFFDYIDENHDGRLDRGEFLKRSFQGEQADARFSEFDSDKSGILTFAEWSRASLGMIDPIGEFLRIDADLDGRLDPAEFLNGTPDWQAKVARHVFPGFDIDRDGFLSLEEYRRIPLVNFFVPWHEPRRDSDNDGRLSSGDFQWGRRPDLACLEAEYFRTFDVNHDDMLDLDEFFFQIDAAKAPRDVVFAQRDLDRDGKLSFDEVLGDFKPPAGSKPDSGYEVRLARMEEAFRKADADHDRSLSLDEFRTPAALEAINPDAPLAQAASLASATGTGPSVAAEGERWRMWLIVGGNVVLIVLVGTYVTFKK